MTDELKLKIWSWVKGGPDHFIFEINVGKKRIRLTSTLKLNDDFFIDSKSTED